VGQRDAAGLGEHKLPFAALEERVTEPLLELAQLDRRCRCCTGSWA
jgi:hypothetical protein